MVTQCAVISWAGFDGDGRERRRSGAEIAPLCLTDSKSTTHQLTMRIKYGLLLLLFGSVLSADELAARGTLPIRGLNETLTSLAAKLTPAVVTISTSGYKPVGANPDGGLSFGLQQASGSGVVVSQDGFIVTNAHVVAQMSRIEVQLPPDAPHSGHSIVRPPGRVLPARLIGIDGETDLALLKVDADHMPFLSLADSDTVRQGQLVMAIGSPVGLESSVSMGIISAVARQIHPDDRVIYLQTDAPINPGNSGGPLVGIDGNLIGINTMMLSQSGGSQGLGFAVPSNIVRFVVDQLRTTGVVVRGEIGVEAQTLTPGLAAALGLTAEGGVILGDVLPGGPGERAGLKTGDIVLALNDKPMENARQFHVDLYQQPVASMVRLKILRGAGIQVVPVLVGERTNSPERFALYVNERQNLVSRLSILALRIDEATARLLPDEPRRPYGVLVARLAVTTHGPRGDLLPGDIIYQVNQKTVSSLPELRALVDAQEAGKPVALQIERAGRIHYVEMRLE